MKPLETSTRLLKAEKPCRGHLSATIGGLLFAVFLLPAFGWTVEPSDSASPRDLLIEALGRAAVYDYEKAESLCDQVLASTDDPALQARAWWVKAVAYSTFILDYRDDRLMDRFQVAVREVKRLQPDLYADVLARRDAHMDILLPENPAIDDLLAEYRSRCEDSASSSAVTAYQLGHAYWQASEILPEEAKEKKKKYLEKALEFIEIAAKQEPDSYEFQMYYLTLLAYNDRDEEAVEVGRELIARFIPFGDFENDRDPYCLYAAAVGKKEHSPDRPWEFDILEQRAKDPDAGAWVHYEIVQGKVGEAETTKEKEELYRRFIRRAEEGEFPTDGYDLRALASAHYKLAYQLSTENRWEDSLAVYRRLSDLTPRYAELNYNQGVILEMMAREEEDLKTRRDLLERAREEYRKQLDLDWKGHTADTLRECIDRVNSLLQEQP
jgi:tetratricopeptide (TPR) repeat protein